MRNVGGTRSGNSQGRATGRESVRLVVAAGQSGTLAGVLGGRERAGSDSASGVVSVSFLIVGAD